MCYYKKMNIKEIKKTLEESEISPLKRFGQNFLVDMNVINKITSLASKDDLIVEVGPGLGSLTFGMARRCKKIIAIEKDKKFVQILKKERIDNLEIIKEDILKLKEIPFKDYKVISNLPFYITSPTIRFFLESKNPPNEMILLVQKEVAKRICSSPPDMSILAVSVQVYSTPKILFHVSRGSFWPSPKVDSSVISIKKLDRNINLDMKSFFRVVKAGFSHPRAQLLNNLSKSLKLDKSYTREKMISAGIAPERRAETVTVQEWIKLLEYIK
jgi:16S rRNA (adenine1518-N6/adenine1519-N6)-dimethyltransferase